MIPQKYKKIVTEYYEQLYTNIQQPKRDGQVSINFHHCSSVAKLYPILL